MNFRDLTAEEIECRVQSVKQNGLVLLLYKNARCDMNILDETVGVANWQREHYECKGNLFCRVGIHAGALYDIEKEANENTPRDYHPLRAHDAWVWKADCGVERNTEAQKGEASDSFKRACFNWGIGRELYTAPFIWIPAKKCNINSGKCYDKFEIEKIIIENKRITAISILNTSIESDDIKQKRCFVWQRDAR